MTATETFKNVRHSLKNNLFKYLLIWTISELIGFLFLKGMTITLLNLAMGHMGISGITNENFFDVFQSPFTVLLLFTALVSLGLLAIIQNLATFNLSLGDGKISNLLSPLKRLRPKDILPLIFYSLIIIPFSNVGLSIYFLSNLKIPDFVLAVVWENYLFTIMYLIFLVIIFFLNFKFYYTFIIFYDQKVSFREALSLSYKRTNGKFFYIAKYMILVFVPTFILSLGIVLLYLIFNVLAIKIPLFEFFFAAVGGSLIVVSTFLLLIIASIYSIQFIVISYKNKALQATPKPKYNFLPYLTGLAVLVVSIYGMFVYTPPSELEDIKIISHRGVMDQAIENTYESLEAAHAKNADYVELDVQQLKDGTLIVYHDPSLKRLTGLNKKVGDVTWEEVEALNIRQNGMVSKIPRFDEYLEKSAELNQKLLVEIKTNPSDSPDFIQQILEHVTKSSLPKSDVLYQSLTLDAMLKVKEFDPNAYTAYIIGFNIGGLDNLNVDAYSIDEMSVTKRVVFDVRRYEKDLLIWSVDTTDVIERAFSKKPFGIITDQIDTIESVKEDLLNNPVSRMLWQLDF